MTLFDIFSLWGGSSTTPTTSELSMKLNLKKKITTIRNNVKLSTAYFYKYMLQLTNLFEYLDLLVIRSFRSMIPYGSHVHLFLFGKRNPDELSFYLLAGDPLCAIEFLVTCDAV